MRVGGAELRPTALHLTGVVKEPRGIRESASLTPPLRVYSAQLPLRPFHGSLTYTALNRSTPHPASCDVVVVGAVRPGDRHHSDAALDLLP